VMGITLGGAEWERRLVANHICGIQQRGWSM
jgi:hypothetical protein